jgi:hypothetical protein
MEGRLRGTLSLDNGGGFASVRPRRSSSLGFDGLLLG